MIDMSLVDSYLSAIEQEYRRASRNFKPFNSAHEGIAVIREEYLELEQATFFYGSPTPACRVEAIQLAAMCLRYLIEVVGKESVIDD